MNAHPPKLLQHLRTLQGCFLAGFLALFGAAPAYGQTAGEPEEPDYAFIVGGPYTQLKDSIQVIHAFNYGTRRFSLPSAARNEDEFLFFFRTEWGFTDRLELDVITPVSGSRERMSGSPTSSDYAYSDTILGLRYRMLTEENAPFTLTMGPQLILPTGSVRKGTGAGSAGFAWDVSAAKDWGGPVFVFASANYSALPSANDLTPGSSRDFTLHGAEWATALGIRALERPVGETNHDVHVFLETGGSWNHEVSPGLTVGTRDSKLAWVFAPGVRYGFITAKKTLVEIGVSVPIGMGPNGPKKGIIIQFQYERVFGAPSK
jgi:hypothetical protein